MKQDLNVLYQFGIFGQIRKTRWPPWPLIGWDIFDYPLNPLNGIQRNLTWSKISISSTKFVFFLGLLVYKNGRPGQSVKKVGHCTQVHVMWPFGSLVSKRGPMTILNLMSDWYGGWFVPFRLFVMARRHNEGAITKKTKRRKRKRRKRKERKDEITKAT